MFVDWSVNVGGKIVMFIDGFVEIFFYVMEMLEFVVVCFIVG